jgi:hypothetical protein
VWPSALRERLQEKRLVSERTAIPSLIAFLPLNVGEALRLAERIAEKYPDPLEREEAQDALVALAAFVRESTDAANRLRMAAGEAILVTTADEVRMPREDWDKIVEAAIAQRRAVDRHAVDG